METLTLDMYSVRHSSSPSLSSYSSCSYPPQFSTPTFLPTIHTNRSGPTRTHPTTNTITNHAHVHSSSAHSGVDLDLDGVDTRLTAHLDYLHREAERFQSQLESNPPNQINPRPTPHQQDPRTSMRPQTQAYTHIVRPAPMRDGNYKLDPTSSHMNSLDEDIDRLLMTSTIAASFSSSSSSSLSSIPLSAAPRLHRPHSLHTSHNHLQASLPDHTPTRSAPPLPRTSYDQPRQSVSTHSLQVPIPSHHSVSPSLSSGASSTPPSASESITSQSKKRSSHANSSRASASSSSGSSSASSSPAPASSTTPAVCVCCRRKKLVCDGVTPSCGRCQTNGLRCTYSPPKRGPAPGIVSHLRGTVTQLQAQLKAMREKGQQQQQQSTQPPHQHPPQPSSQLSKHQQLQLHLQQQFTRLPKQLSTFESGNLRVIRDFLSQLSTSRNEAYLASFFFTLNNSLFPFLDRREFVLHHARFVETPTIQPATSWIFQYSTAMAIGAATSGDETYARYAITIARVVSCQMFDQPSYDAIRAFLLMAYYLIVHQQHRRGACYLAIAKRMLFVVPMLHANKVCKSNPFGVDQPSVPLTPIEHTRLHEQLKLMTQFLDDMLVSSNWWKGSGAMKNEQLRPAEIELVTNETPTSTVDSFPSPNPTATADAFFPHARRATKGIVSSPMAWTDLLLDPATDLHRRESTPHGMSHKKDVASPISPSSNYRTASPSDSDGEFRYNRVNPTILRGGNPGLFEFERAPDGRAKCPLDGSEPMKPIDVQESELKLALHQQSTQVHSSSFSSVPKKRKRASSVDRIPHVSTPAAAAASVGLNASPQLSSDPQLNLMRVMATLSGVRGNVELLRQDKDAVVKLHKCLSILTDSDYKLAHQLKSTPDAASPAVSNIRAMVACMKTVCLKLLSLLDAGEDRIAQRIQSSAKETSLLTQQCDLTFCPLFAVFYHVTAQCHLTAAQTIIKATTSSSSSSSSSPSPSVFQYLLLDLHHHERLALRWEFARPIFANLQARVRLLLSTYYNTGLFVSRNVSALPRISDANLAQLLERSIPVSNSSGVNTNQTGGSLQSNENSPFIHIHKLNAANILPVQVDNRITHRVGNTRIGSHANVVPSGYVQRLPESFAVASSSIEEYDAPSSNSSASSSSLTPISNDNNFDSTDSPSHYDEFQQPPRKRHQPNPPNGFYQTISSSPPIEWHPAGFMEHNDGGIGSESEFLSLSNLSKFPSVIIQPRPSTSPNIPPSFDPSYSSDLYSIPSIDDAVSSSTDVNFGFPLASPTVSDKPPTGQLTPISIDFLGRSSSFTSCHMWSPKLPSEGNSTNNTNGLGTVPSPLAITMSPIDEIMLLSDNE